VVQLQQISAREITWQKKGVGEPSADKHS